MFLFIKGSYDQPKCKFTRKLCEHMWPLNYRNIKTLNILENERIRQWLKFYSKWPTFPQIFLEGKFAGGVDVVCELIQEGEFQEMVPKQCQPLPAQEALAEYLAAHKLICFIRKDQEAPKGLPASFAVCDVDKSPEWLPILEQQHKVTSWPQFFQDARPCSQDEIRQPQPAAQAKKPLEERLKELTTMHDIVLFMKGEPADPQCGFSRRMVALIEKHISRADYRTFDVYSDSEVREGLKAYSKWPTYPQLYVKGKLLGGIDVCQEMDEEQELEDALAP